MATDNERDFNKVLESINSLESKIIDLEIFIREKLIEVHNMDKENITHQHKVNLDNAKQIGCLLYTSPSPRDRSISRMPSSA